VKRAERRRDPEARATTLLAPVAYLSLTSMLACVDAIVLTESSTPSPVFPRPTPPDSPAVASDGVPRTVEPSPPVDVPAAYPSHLRVRLERVAVGQTVQVSVTGGWRLHVGSLNDLSRAPGALIAIGDALKTAQVSSVVRGIRMNGEILPHPSVTLIPDHSGALEIDGREYRGVFLLEASEHGLDVVNVVDLEDYVAGVLHAEMPSRFPTEARRAQAVAARTYALYHATRGRDLRDDQGSQVYLGTERESDEARRIVASTAGEVLTSGGVPFETYFHSTCGGVTSSATRVFGPAAPPPLQGDVVCDACVDAPRYRWKVTVDPARIEKMYRGVLDSFRTIRVIEEDDGGRALLLELIDTASETLDRKSADRFRNDYNIGLPLSRQLLSAFFTSIRHGSTGIVVEGRGFGHGVGLCQYGAGGYAGRGSGYRQILSHYYPESEITRLDR